MTKTIAEMSIDTRTVVDLLKKLPVGEVLPYSAIADATGREITGRHRYILESARRVALRDGMVFAAVHGEGMKRLADTEIVAIGAQAIGHIRRTAKRSVVKLAAVKDFDAMPASARIEHNAAMSVLGVIAHVGSSAQVKSATAAVQAVGNNTVPPVKMLAHFASKS